MTDKKSEKSKTFTERGMERRLAVALASWLRRVGGSVRTFEEASVLTSNRGLVVTLPGRQEFQLTIVKSAGRAVRDDFDE